MKFSKKTKLVFILVAVFLIGLAVPSYSWTRKNVKEIETFYNSKLSPIIMIPGSSATENRFDGLVRKTVLVLSIASSRLRFGTMGVSPLRVKSRIRITSQSLLLDLRITKMAITISRNKPR